MSETVHMIRRRLYSILDLLAIGGPLPADRLLGREVYASGKTHAGDLDELVALGCATLEGGLYKWAARLPDPYLLPDSRARLAAQIEERQAKVAACEHEWGDWKEVRPMLHVRSCRKCQHTEQSDSTG